MIRFAGRAALVGLALYACDSERNLDRTDTARSAGRVVVTAGALRGRFPARPDDVRGDTIIEGAFGMVVGDGSVFVLDQLASRILRVDLDGELLARFGSPGEGPGELTNPFALALGPDGDVWVADPGGSRLSRYHVDGEPVADYRMPYPVINFAVLDRGPVFPTLSAATLLGSAGPGGEMAELAVDETLVPVRISRGPEDRVAPHVLRLARLPGGDVALLQNRHGTRFALWRVRLSAGGERIEDVRPLPLPGWLATMLGRETERIRRDTPAEFASGDFLIPFKGMHVAGDRLWLAPATSAAALAVGVPLRQGDPLAVVVADEDVYRGAIDAAVVGERLVVLYRTELRTYDLEPASAGRFSAPAGGG